jgi:uncharacterized membrane protein
MTVSKSFAQCDTNSICTKKVVLKYLYLEAEKSAYLQNDTSFLNEIIANQRAISVVKDSLIANRDEALELCYDRHSLVVTDLNTSKKQVKSLTKKVSLFKTVSASLSAACVAMFLLK